MGSGESDVVGIAVTNSLGAACGGGRPPVNLMKFSKSSSLKSLMSDLCKHWSVDLGVDDVELRFEASNELVAEANKADIRDGTILKLCPAAHVVASEIVQQLGSSDEAAWHRGSLQLFNFSSDASVVQHFISQSGLSVLMKALHTECQGRAAQRQAETALLGALVDIMKHDEVSWQSELFDADFIMRVASSIVANNTSSLKHCLAILENLSAIPGKSQLIQDALPVRSLLELLVDELSIQRCVLSIFNNMFNMASADRRQQMRCVLEDLNVRQTLVDKFTNKKVSEEMKRQLFLLQCHLMCEAAERMLTPVDRQDPKFMDKIKELRRLAFRDIASGKPGSLLGPVNRGRYSEDYKSLGFISTRDPLQDFGHVPPGMLALDLMLYFAQNRTDCYSKLVLENSCRDGDNHECPFAATSIALTKLLCTLLNVGCSSTGLAHDGDFQPMMLTLEQPLEEVFCVCIQHLFKTWREMRATNEDFDKVMEVTKEQVESALKETPLSLDQFRGSLKSYSQVHDGWKEAAKLRSDIESRSVDELREILRPEIVNLVQRQRLCFVGEGTRFEKQRRSGSTHIFIRLSPNHKTLYYDDSNDAEAVPPIENLRHKVLVSDLKAFLTGQDSVAHVGRDGGSRRKFAGDFAALAMTFLTDATSLDVLAPNQKTFDYWCDAVNALMRKDMVSNLAHEDIDLFLTMEIKIQLLDVEGIALPKEPPAIPPLPANYDFYRDKRCQR